LPLDERAWVRTLQQIAVELARLRERVEDLRSL
jgi:hypothetical protein